LTRSEDAASGLTIVGDEAADDAARAAAKPEAVHVVEAADTERIAGVVEAWLFAADQEPRQVALDDVSTFVADDANFVWVDLSAYAEDELRALATALDLHPNAVRAALSTWQRPRLSVYPNHFFVSATVARPSLETLRVLADELDLFVGRNFLVSAHRHPLPFADHLHARAIHRPDLVALNAAFMLYIILDELLAHYEELDRQQQAEVERIEERALHETSDDFLEDVVRFKRHAFALAQLSEQHREVLAAFLRPDFGWVSGEDVEESFRSLQARLAYLLDALQGAREAANGALDIHVSHMAHRTNQVIKVLTMASIVLFVASVLIALVGVTLRDTVLSYGTSGWLAFVGMLLVIGLVSAGVLFGFRRRGWL
jgi:magnesium transporter